MPYVLPIRRPPTLEGPVWSLLRDWTWLCHVHASSLGIPWTGCHLYSCC